MLHEFLTNLLHNLFKPLLLFFYAGFLIPLLRVKFEFPKPIYQGLTIYLLLAIGWHGGEELAALPPMALGQAFGFMVLGFLTNGTIGLLAYWALRKATQLRQIDAAAVAGYYGSDSAGTFVTAMGVLASVQIAFAPYMPVLLAVMEIPGCLVALYLVSRLRSSGMDANGNMPGERHYQPTSATASRLDPELNGRDWEEAPVPADEEAELVGAAASGSAIAYGRTRLPRSTSSRHRTTGARYSEGSPDLTDQIRAEEEEATLALEPTNDGEFSATPVGHKGFLSPALLHEVFLNPGIFLLFAGVAIGFVSRLQGEKVTAADDALFVNLFQGVLCLFLLEMGMTAASKLHDLRTAGWRFIVFGLAAPNLFAVVGLGVAHLYSLFWGTPFDVGTYVLFAVLCGSASYIAVPAVQRMAIREASPTLPLATSLGLTFSYNVTIGIPVYLMLAKLLTAYFPVHAI
jgi:hypothetical protein